MALDARLIGQAMSGGRPLDIAGAVQPAVQRGEQAIQRARLVEERRQQLQAEAIAQLPQLDESQVPMQMREWAMGKALEARSQALEAIRNKDLNPVERQMAIQNAVASIGKVATKAGDFKQWIAQFADTSPEDLSKLNSPQLMERVNDIFQGNFKVSGDEFVFADGTVKDFNSLVNTRHISRRSDAYRNQLTAIGQSYEKYGLQGWDENDFESKINEELNNTKYSDADIASIVVDELGVDLPKGITIDQIREDFEDNGKLDDLGDNVKNQLIDIIKNNYKKAAKTSYDRAYGRYEKIASAKINKDNNSGSINKWEFDEKKRQQELQVIAKTLNPLGKILNNKPINKEQSKSIINYANNKLPGVEIYQSTATDDDGNLLNPNAYVIDIDGKRKPFVIGETQGTAVFKLIKDLYGYSATERITMFDTKKDNDDFDESAYEITPSIDVVGTLEDINKADTLSQLNEKSASESAKNKIQKEQAGIR